MRARVLDQYDVPITRWVEAERVAPDRAKAIFTPDDALQTTARAMLCEVEGHAPVLATIPARVDFGIGEGLRMFIRLDGDGSPVL